MYRSSVYVLFTKWSNYLIIISTICLSYRLTCSFNFLFIKSFHWLLGYWFDHLLIRSFHWLFFILTIYLSDHPTNWSSLGHPLSCQIVYAYTSTQVILSSRLGQVISFSLDGHFVILLDHLVFMIRSARWLSCWTNTRPYFRSGGCLVEQMVGLAVTWSDDHILLHLLPWQDEVGRDTKDNLEQNYWCNAADKGLVNRSAILSWFDTCQIIRKSFWSCSSTIWQ